MPILAWCVAKLYWDLFDALAPPLTSKKFVVIAYFLWFGYVSCLLADTQSKVRSSSLLLAGMFTWWCRCTGEDLSRNRICWVSRATGHNSKSSENETLLCYPTRLLSLVGYGRCIEYTKTHSRRWRFTLAEEIHRRLRSRRFIGIIIILKHRDYHTKDANRSFRCRPRHVHFLSACSLFSSEIVQILPLWYSCLINK